jgi:hypothetical protein
MMGVPPPTLATRSDVPAAFAAVLGPMQAALDDCGARGPFASVAWGRPDPDDGQWLALADFATFDGAVPAIRRYPHESDFAKLTEFWVFQNATGTALLAAGYLYAAQWRVPLLAGNTLIHNSQWLQHARLVEPRLWVLPHDPLSGLPGVTIVADREALTEVLFAEVRRTYGPIVQAFLERRQASLANAWASVVDGLLQGFLLAGRAAIGLDAAWELWRTTIQTWDVETRRWPRRLQFCEREMEDELVVRAACCLVFSIKDSSGLKKDHCPNCPIDIGDTRRIRWMVDWLKQLSADEPSVADHTSTEG